jgi:predicted extracellular nuclease
MGDQLEDFASIVDQYGNETWIYPTTRPNVERDLWNPYAWPTVKTEFQPVYAQSTNLLSNKNCSGITFSDYKVRYFGPSLDESAPIVDHVVSKLKTPDILLFQYGLNNNYPLNDTDADANQTISLLIRKISALSTVKYAHTQINPVNGYEPRDPDKVIRAVYLYNPEVIRLHKPNMGNSNDSNQVLIGSDGRPELKYNPGLISAAQTSTWYTGRKPLVAAWETLDGKNVFFTVGIHFTAPEEYTFLMGLDHALNTYEGGVKWRTAQAKSAGDFIGQILTVDKAARIIVAGDFQDFPSEAPVQMFTKVHELQDLEVVMRVPKVERYTAMIRGSCQRRDYAFVSRGVRAANGGYEHIHLDTWKAYQYWVTDHDPSIMKVDVCENRGSNRDLLEPLVEDDESHS